MNDFLLFKFFIDGFENLDKHHNQWHIKHNRLKIEKVCISRKSIKPSNPHKNCAKHREDSDYNQYHNAFNIFDKKPEIKANKCEIK